MKLGWKVAMVGWGKGGEVRESHTVPRERKMQSIWRQLRLGNPNFGMERTSRLQRILIA